MQQTKDPRTGCLPLAWGGIALGGMIVAWLLVATVSRAPAPPPDPPLVMFAGELLSVALRLFPIAVLSAIGIAAWRWATRAGAERLQDGLLRVAELRAVHQTPQPHVYSPRIELEYSGDRPALPVALDALPAVAPALPGITDLADVLRTFRPAASHVLLGLGPGGEPVTVPAPALWHIATAGPTGAGKSNIHRLILAQLLACGARVAIADPKWTDYDAEANEDWRPIGRRLHIAPAVNPQAIGELLTWSASELDRRLATRRAGQRTGPPLFLTIDELPWIAENVPDAAAHVAELARLGRGVGLFLLCASQDWLVKTVGLSGARDQFRSAFYLGGDLKTGSVLLDMPQRDLAAREGELDIGLALLRSAASRSAQLVRVPRASNEALYRLLPAPAEHTSSAASDRGAGSPSEVGLEVGLEVGDAAPLPGQQNAPDARAMRVRDLLRQKASQNDIIREVWQATSGRAYQDAQRELRDIIAQLIGGL